MRIYHQKHGILHVTDQAEINLLLDTGGEVFNIKDKPWQRKAKEVLEEDEVIEEKQEETEQELTINAPKRGRPFKHGHK